MQELEKLNRDDLLNMYKFLNTFNKYPKSMRKTIIKKIKEMADSK